MQCSSNTYMEEEEEEECFQLTQTAILMSVWYIL